MSLAPVVRHISTEMINDCSRAPHGGKCLHMLGMDKAEQILRIKLRGSSNMLLFRERQTGPPSISDPLCVPTETPQKVKRCEHAALSAVDTFGCILSVLGNV